MHITIVSITELAKLPTLNISDYLWIKAKICDTRYANHLCQMIPSFGMCLAQSRHSVFAE